MRKTRIALIVTVMGATAVALAQPPAQQPDKTFTSGAEVEAMIAKAKAERKPDQPNFIQPLLRLAPYAVNLEYRVEGIDTTPNVHEKQAELVYVVEGAGTFTMGGKLRDEKRLNAGNLTGSSIEGGAQRHISKGDFIFVPENTAHAFTNTQGTLVIMSLHLPRGEASR